MITRLFWLLDFFFVNLYNKASFFEANAMSILQKQSTVTVETKTNKDRKSGVETVVAVSFKSSNGLLYKITNYPKSNSRTHVQLTFNEKVIMDGVLNISAYRADSFLECEGHTLFKLNKDDIETFLKNHENDTIGTLFINYGFHSGASCIWINGKINHIIEDNELDMMTESISSKYRATNVIEKFLYSNSIVKKTTISTNIKGNISIFKMLNNDDTCLFYSTYDTDTKTGVFKLRSEPKTVVEGLTSSKYKALLNDHLSRWAINNPNGKFEKIVNDYGFNDDMNYNQTKKMLKMINI
jgi:hypothetical protein